MSFDTNSAYWRRRAQWETLEAALVSNETPRKGAEMFNASRKRRRRFG
jgi:hypothetical protein